MSPAALALTLLFVADDPQVPSVVVDVVEDAAGRRVDVVVVPVLGAAPGVVGTAGTSVGLRDAPAEGSRALRDWPLLPRGASLTPTADGLILTIDDAGAWQPVPATNLTVSTPTKKSAAPNVMPLPVAGERSLRLFLPTVVDERPAPASLHGTRTRAGGTVVVLQRAAPVTALTVSGSGAGLEADGGDALLAAELPACGALAGAPGSGSVVQAWTRSSSTSTTCTAALAVGALVGRRLGDKPERDVDARGIVVVRRPPAPTATGPTATGPSATGPIPPR